jgi:O-antigen ligase
MTLGLYIQTMILYLPPLLFVCVGWFLDDPVSLFSSFVLIVVALLSVLNIKKISRKFNLAEYLLAMLAVWYVFLAIIQQQFYGTVLIGGYARNFGIATIFAMLLILLKVRNTFTEIYAEKFISVSLMALMLLMNIYGFLQYTGADPLPWNNDSQIVQLTLGNSNFAGALFGIMTTVPIIATKKNTKIPARILCTLLFVSNFFLGLQTETLQFKLLFAVSIVFIIFGLVLNEKKLRFRIIKQSIVLGGLTLTILFILGMTNQFASSFVKNVLLQGSATQRLEFWRIGYKIWETNPLFGIGIANFQNHAGEFRSPTQIILEGPNVIPDRAHNVFIDHFAEGGIIAGIIWLILIGLVSYTLLKILLVTTETEDKIKYSIIGSIWVTYVIQSFISPDHILLITIGFISAGFILSRYNCVIKNSQQAENKAKLKIFEIHRVIAAFLIFGVILVYGKAMVVNNELRNLLRKDNVTQVEITEAINGWEFNAITEDIGTRVLAGGKQTCGLVQDISDRLLSINSRSSAGWYLKANCSNLDLRFDQAVKEVNKSLEFDPNNSIFLEAKAKLLIAANKPKEALKVVEEIQGKYPNSEVLPMLQQSVENLQGS